MSPFYLAVELVAVLVAQHVPSSLDDDSVFNDDDDDDDDDFHIRFFFNRCSAAASDDATHESTGPIKLDFLLWGEF